MSEDEYSLKLPGEVHFRPMALPSNKLADPQTEIPEYEEQWTGDHIFESKWQSFRIKKNRSLDLVSTPHEYEKSERCKIAVKIVDIFGNDTMKVISVTV